MPNEPIDPAHVAQRFRLLMYGILALIATNIASVTIPQEYELIAVLLGVAVSIGLAFLIWDLGSAMQWETGGKVLAVIGLFIPFVGIVVLLVINSKCVAVLKDAGYRVGLMGAKKGTGPQ